MQIFHVCLQRGYVVVVEALTNELVENACLADLRLTQDRDPIVKTRREHVQIARHDKILANCCQQSVLP